MKVGLCKTEGIIVQQGAFHQRRPSSEAALLQTGQGWRVAATDSQALQDGLLRLRAGSLDGLPRIEGPGAV